MYGIQETLATSVTYWPFYDGQPAIPGDPIGGVAINVPADGSGTVVVTLPFGLDLPMGYVVGLSVQYPGTPYAIEAQVVNKIATGFEVAAFGAPPGTMVSIFWQLNGVGTEIVEDGFMFQPFSKANVDADGSVTAIVFPSPFLNSIISVIAQVVGATVDPTLYTVQPYGLTLSGCNVYVGGGIPGDQVTLDFQAVGT